MKWNYNCPCLLPREIPGYSTGKFSSVQSLGHVRLFATPWTTAYQDSLSITNSRSLSKPMSIESVMPSNHLILCRPLLLPLSIFPSIRVFSNESAPCGHKELDMTEQLTHTFPSNFTVSQNITQKYLDFSLQKSSIKICEIHDACNSIFLGTFF